MAANPKLFAVIFQVAICASSFSSSSSSSAPNSSKEEAENPFVK